MEHILYLWSTLPALTQGFIAFTALLGLALCTYWYSAPAVIYGPAVLMSIGIFGTFFGIAIGLSEFDANNVQQSIPGLLDGLKTSFWSSISGLFFALIIKGRQLWEGLQRGRHGELPTGATIDDLATILGQVRFALAGDDEATVVGQIKLGRQDNNDRLDALKRDLKEFMEEMTSSGTEALVQALEEVIRDFNAKINEQFGENFKQLNEAVGKILEWQEQYRHQMQEMISQQKESSQNLRVAAEGFSVAVQQSKEFANTARELDGLLKSLSQERERIQQLTVNLAESLSACQTAIPDMEQKVVNLAGVLESTVRETSETAVRSIGSANTEINQQLSKLANQTSQSVDELDKALNEQLTQSLEMFGRQLAALSEKFAADYTPITESLRRVLVMARGAAS